MYGNPICGMGLPIEVEVWRVRAVILWICGSLTYWLAFWVQAKSHGSSRQLANRLAHAGVYLAITGLTGSLLALGMCCAFSTPPLQTLQLISVVMLNAGLGLTGADLLAPLRWILRPWKSRVQSQMRELEESFMWESPTHQDSQFL